MVYTFHCQMKLWQSDTYFLQMHWIHFSYDHIIRWPLCLINILFYLSKLSRIFVTSRTIQSMEFSRPKYWSGSCSLLQGIFPTQGLNPGLPHCRQILSSWATREALSLLWLNNIPLCLYNMFSLSIGLWTLRLFPCLSYCK